MDNLTFETTRDQEIKTRESIHPLTNSSNWNYEYVLGHQGATARYVLNQLIAQDVDVSHWIAPEFRSAVKKFKRRNDAISIDITRIKRKCGLHFLKVAKIEEMDDCLQQLKDLYQNAATNKNQIHKIAIVLSGFRWFAADGLHSPMLSNLDLDTYKKRMLNVSNDELMKLKKHELQKIAQYKVNHPGDQILHKIYRESRYAYLERCRRRKLRQVKLKLQNLEKDHFSLKSEPVLVKKISIHAKYNDACISSIAVSKIRKVIEKSVGLVETKFSQLFSQVYLYVIYDMSMNYELREIHDEIKIHGEGIIRKFEWTKPEDVILDEFGKGTLASIIDNLIPSTIEVNANPSKWHILDKLQNGILSTETMQWIV